LKTALGGQWHPDAGIRTNQSSAAARTGPEPRAKAQSGLPGNDRPGSAETPKARRAAATERAAGEKAAPAVQDTAPLNYNAREKTEGPGYISGETKGVNIRSCTAVTPDGLAYGVPDQSRCGRGRAKDGAMTKGEKRNRPAGEKEAAGGERRRGLKRYVPAAVKEMNCLTKPKGGLLFLARAVQNRMTAGNGRILDEIRKKPRGGRGRSP
jgi:hypothetical protein